MHKSDTPYYLLLLVIVAVGVFVLQMHKKEVAYENMGLQASVATISRTPFTSYYSINNSEKESKLLATVANSSKESRYSQKTLTGTVYVIHTDSKNYREDADIYESYLVTKDGVYKIENLGTKLNPSINGANVSVSGYVADSGKQKTLLTAIGVADLKNIKPKTILPRRWDKTDDRSSVCNGNYCALVIPIDATNAVLSNLPNPQLIAEHIFSGAIHNVFFEQSSGAMIYGGTVTDWIESNDIPQLFEAPNGVEEYLTEHGINVSSYDEVVFLVNGGPRSNGGMGTVGAGVISIGENSYNIPVSLVGFSNYGNDEQTMANGNLSYFDYLYSHEVGHNLGAIHDNILNCDKSPLALPSKCLFVEYGNNYSIMGNGSLGGDFSVLNKIRIGWVVADNVIHGNDESTALNPTELPNPTYLSIDQESAVPQYMFERRISTGIDTVNLWNDVNLNGAFMYRQNRGYNYLTLSSNPQSWEMDLVDTTPGSTSTAWPTSIKDAVFKIPQNYNDASLGKNFRQMAGGNNNLIKVAPITPSACVMRAPQVFGVAGAQDVFMAQIPNQKWGIAGGGLSISSPAVATLHADVADPNASVLVYKSIEIFNDDSLNCSPADYTFKLKYNGADLPLLSDESGQYMSWSGPYYQTLYAFVPVGGETYGQKTLTLEVKKLNDNTTFTKALKFNLAP